MAKSENRIEEISKIDRPITGDTIPLFIFRAFRHFTADYVTQMIGKRSSVVFQNGGRELGHEAGTLLKKPTLDEYLQAVIQFVSEMKIGQIKPREVSSERIILGLDECITCAGMSNIGQRICHFETGFVAGVVESFVGTKLRAFESKCNANGEGICEVTVDLQQTANSIKTSSDR